MTKNANFNKTENEKSETSMTYAELLELYCGHLQKTGKSLQEIKNVRSAIKSWREALKLDFRCCVSAELNSKFDQSIKIYKSYERRRRISKSTYSSRVSVIKLVRNFYLGQLSAYSLPDTFAERFRFLLKLNNYSVRKFHQLFFDGVTSYGRLRHWAMGSRAPRTNGLTVVEKIEQCLQVPQGTLLSTARKPIISSTLTVQSEVRRIYCVWTPKLETEFQKFVQYKTSVVPPFGMARTEAGVWTGEKGKTPPSALVFKGNLRRFFGFLCLPTDSPDLRWRGCGMSEDELSLAHLTDINLVEAYLTVFQTERRGGVYNSGALTFIVFVMSLLRKDFGYLYQKPEFALGLNLPSNIPAWQKRCLKTRQRLSEVRGYIERERSSGGEKFGFGRDPKERIQAILDAPRPLVIVMKMVEDMLKDVKKTAHAPIEQAILYRDILLIAMMQANPLRLKMYEMMKFDENLVREEDGSWWIKFKRTDFKNKNSLKHDYRVQVASPLWEMIDTYKEIFRPRFKESQNSSHVFRLESETVIKAKSSNETINQTLSSRIYIRTKQYIKNCKGFRSHSFRHIVATDIVKANQSFGFFLAAKVLHDKPETVEANYAHLKTGEFYEPYNQIFTSTWNSVKQSAVKEKPEILINVNQNGNGREVGNEKGQR